MKKLMILFFTVLMVNILVFSDYNYRRENYSPQSYDKAKVVRVKYTKGEVMIQRSYDKGFEEASLNTPIFEGDAIETTDGRAEIYLGKYNYLRLDYDTRVEFATIHELDRTNIKLRVIRGGIYLDISEFEYERDIEVQTKDCGVFVLEPGQYRINVRENYNTEVVVLEGLVEIAGNDYNRNIKRRQKIVMQEGEVIQRPYYLYSSEKDDFDYWNKDRHRITQMRNYYGSRYLDQGYEDYEYELSRNGRWRYNTTYNTYIWIPHNLGSTWRPYYNGRWIWNPYYGYVWHSYDSWGWFTHYYGSWEWDYYSGWYWVPRYRWSPGWVYWFWSGDYYGWCPLSYRNRPVIVINKRWLRNYNFNRGLPINSYSAVIIRKRYLTSPYVNKYVIRNSSVIRVGSRTIIHKGHAPTFKPSYKHITVINAKGQKVLFKKSGIISTRKYITVNKGRTVYKKTGVSTGVIYKYNSGKTYYKKSPVYKYSSKSKIINKKSSGNVIYKKSGSSTIYKKSSKTYYKSSNSYKIKNKKYNSGSSTTYKSKSTVYKPKKRKHKSSTHSTSSSTSHKIIKKKKRNNYYSPLSSSYNYQPSSNDSYRYKNKSYYNYGGSNKIYYKTGSKSNNSNSDTYKSKKYNSYYSNYSSNNSSKRYYRSKSYKSYKSNNRYSYYNYKPSHRKSYSSSYYYTPKSSSYSSYHTKPSYKSSYTSKSYSNYSYPTYKTYSKSYSNYSKSTYKSYSSPKTYSYSRPSYKTYSTSKSSSKSYSTSSSSSSRKIYRKKK